jgi:CrcB protein
MTALYVILGAAIGAPSRFLLDQYFRRYIKYPYGILIINVLGSFILGLSIGPGDNFHTFIGLGFTGAFTTWSTFIMDVYLASELKRYKEVTTNVILSLLLGLGAAWIGFHLTH